MALPLAVPSVSPAAGPIDDGRTIELVSTGLESGRGVTSVAPVVDPSGQSLIFDLNQGQSDSPSARSRVHRVATRSATGWTSRSADTTVKGDPSGEFGSTFSVSAFQQVSPSADRVILTGAPRDARFPHTSGTFTIDTAAGTARLIGPGDYVGSSRSTDVIFFKSTGDFAPGADSLPASTVKIYRVDQQGTRLASTVPAATFANPDLQVASIVEATVQLGNDQGFSDGYILDTLGPPNPPNFTLGDRVTVPVGGGRRNVVSDDGSRLFFQGGAPERPTSNRGLLYPLWLSDGDAPAVAVSASRRTGDNQALRAAQLIGASRDGTTALFVAGEPLLDGETSGGIYRYVRTIGGMSGELTRITPDTEAGFDGLGVRSAWASDDADTLYFVSSAKLTDEATAGGRNAYVWTGGELQFIADLGEGGAVERVSPNGEYAVLSSANGLGGAQTGTFSQLFRYQRTTGALRCASCRADGSANAGRAAIDYRPDDFPGGNGDFLLDYNTPRGITDSGHVFFTSLDGLVAGDIPAPAAPAGTTPADLEPDQADVYEFDDEGVRLLSTGEGESLLVDNTEDGRSVFFISSATLADDDDVEFDLFVRRAGGGFPPPPPGRGPCQGDGCQGSAAAASAQRQPGSDRVGAGNVQPAPKAALLSAPRISSAGRRALARGSRAAISVRLRGPGPLTVRLNSRAGKRRTLASAATTIRSGQTQTKRVTVRLTRAARQQLRRDGRLRISIRASLAGSESRSASATLRREGL